MIDTVMFVRRSLSRGRTVVEMNVANGSVNQDATVEDMVGTTSDRTDGTSKGKTLGWDCFRGFDDGRREKRRRGLVKSWWGETTESDVLLAPAESLEMGTEVRLGCVSGEMVRLTARPSARIEASELLRSKRLASTVSSGRVASAATILSERSGRKLQISSVDNARPLSVTEPAIMERQRIR